MCLNNPVSRTCPCCPPITPLQAMRVLCLLWGGRLEAATELAQSLPALVDAGNHTVESKAAGLAGRYVPCHDSQGPALRLGSSPFKVGGES
jgi:hypothetical protein